MTAGRARAVLAATWLGFFVLALGSILYLRLGNEIEADNVAAGMERINTLYAPFVGAILLFYWGARAPAAPKPVAAGGRFILALVVTALWNLMIMSFLFAPVVLKRGAIEDALAGLGTAGGLFTWLVAGALGYYFATPAQDA